MNGRISDTMITVLTAQAVREKFNSNVYSSMANNLDVLGFCNSAKYMEKQSHEEQEHFEKIWKYLTDRNCKVGLDEIPAVPNEYDCIIDAFNDAQTLEFGTTEEWKKIYNLCVAEADWITKQLASEFMDIQYVEETEIMKICDSLKAIGKKPEFLVMWDNTFEF